MDWLAESASAGWWGAERNRDRLGEKAEGDLRKEIRGSCSCLEAGPQGVLCEEWILQVGCSKAKNCLE